MCSSARYSLLVTRQSAAAAPAQAQAGARGQARTGGAGPAREARGRDGGCLAADRLHAQATRGQPFVPHSRALYSYCTVENRIDVYVFLENIDYE